MRAPPRSALIAGHALVQLAVGLTLIGVAERVGVWSSPLGLPWWLVAAGFLLVEASALHIEINRETHSLSLSGIPLLLGLLSLDPVALLTARLVGSATALIVVRRRAGLKLAWNLSLYTLETGAASLIAVAALRNGEPEQLSAWLVLLGAALAAELISLLSVPLVIMIAEGRLRLALYDQVGRSQLLAVVGSTYAVVATAAMLHRRSLAVFAVVPLVGVAALLRVFGRLGKEHHDLEQLHGFATTIARRDSLDAGLAELGVILRAGHAALAVRDAEGRFTVRLSHDGAASEATIDTGAAPPPDEGGLVEIHHGGPRNEATALLEALGATQGLAFPIGDQIGEDGYVLVGDRHGATDRFGREEARLFASLASTLGSRLSADRLLDRLEVQARIDPLTGLANRTTIEAELDHRISAADGAGAVLLIDLDRFKDVNDSLGHHFGDQLLQEVATRLQTVLRQGDQAGRLGGDEFVVLIDLPSPGALDHHLDGLTRRLGLPVELEGITIELGASIGVAEWPEDATTSAELLRLADIAMYEAKRTHQPWVRFEPDIEYAGADRLSLIGELRDAIADHDLVLHLQPQVRADDLELVGAEALLRWEHPVHGLLFPADFLPLAERSSLAGPITRHVIEEAVRVVAHLRSVGLDLMVAVNLTARDLLDRSLPPVVAAALESGGVPPGSLTFEVTESSLIVDLDTGIETLTALRAIGCRTSVDDFGTGYSSLQYLQRLPVDEVKIDRSFVTDVVTNPNSAAIVRSIAVLIRDLGRDIVAEGVEDQPTLELLRDLGCDTIQGYLISRPMPVADFAAWASRHRSHSEH